MEEFETRTVDAGELRVDAQGVSKVIRGYAIVFNRLSENLGFFREQIAPAAIDRTLKEGMDLRALIDHDTRLILGRLRANTLRVEKDAHGLRVEIDPPATSYAENIMVSIRRGDVTGMSFAFRSLQDDWDETTDPPTRTVTDMLVREVSVVTFPAYPQTEVAMRSWRAHEQARGPVPRRVSDRMRWWQEKMRLTGGRDPV